MTNKFIFTVKFITSNKLKIKRIDIRETPFPDERPLLIADGSRADRWFALPRCILFTHVEYRVL